MNIRPSKKRERPSTARTRPNYSTRLSTSTSHSYDHHLGKEHGGIGSHTVVTAAEVEAAAAALALNGNGNVNESATEMIMTGNDAGYAGVRQKYQEN